MIPVIALVGRTNVGKSTLFNRLTRTRDAIVANIPGLTRDRQYGEGKMGDKPFIVVDTGGIADEEEAIDDEMSCQSWQAISEADIILFLVDGRSGLTAADEQIATRMRQLTKSVHLVVNKTDGVDADVAKGDFYSLGLSEPYTIAAAHGRGVNQMIHSVLADMPEAPEIDEKIQGVKLAIIGRPNVGKSTLVNRLLGEDRVVVFDEPGTTRDSIFIPLERLGKQYTLIDTAGVRRRGKVKQTVEKFSVIKTLQSIENSNVVIMVIDAREGVTEQDMHLIRFAIDAGRALVVAVNKWDGLTQDEKSHNKIELQRRLQFADFARWHFISALHGSGVGNLYKSIDEAYRCANKTLVTSKLNDLLILAVQAHEPPMVRGRRIKLRYAHAGGHNPPIIVVHGNQTEEIPDSYVRYLEHYYRDALKIKGTPIKIQFKTGDNPYKGIKNKLTLSQERKRKRLIKFVKKKK